MPVYSRTSMPAVGLRRHVRVQLAGGRVVGREGEREQPALVARRRRTVPLMSMNVEVSPFSITRMRPARSATNTRALSPGGEPAQIGCENVPSETSEGAAAAGAASANASKSVIPASRIGSDYPRTRTVRVTVRVLPARVHRAHPQRDRKRRFPAQRAAHRAHPARSELHPHDLPLAGGHRRGRPAELRHALDRRAHRRAAGLVRPQRDREPLEPPHAAHAAHRQRERARAPVRRDGRGRGRRGAGQAESAPSTSRYTDPLSDTTNSRPHMSSPKELSRGTSRPSGRVRRRVREIHRAQRGRAEVAVHVAPEQGRQPRVADDVAARDRAEPVAARASCRAPDR